MMWAAAFLAEHPYPIGCRRFDVVFGLENGYHRILALHIVLHWLIIPFTLDAILMMRSFNMLHKTQVYGFRVEVMESHHNRLIKFVAVHASVLTFVSSMSAWSHAHVLDNGNVFLDSREYARTVCLPYGNGRNYLLPVPRQLFRARNFSVNDGFHRNQQLSSTIGQ